MPIGTRDKDFCRPPLVVYKLVWGIPRRCDWSPDWRIDAAGLKAGEIQCATVHLVVWRALLAQLTGIRGCAGKMLALWGRIGVVKSSWCRCLTEAYGIIPNLNIRSCENCIHQD